jgi:hypothetical protein
MTVREEARSLAAAMSLNLWLKELVLAQSSRLAGPTRGAEGPDDVLALSCSRGK